MTRGRLATVTLIVMAALWGAACSASSRSTTANEGFTGSGSGPAFSPAPAGGATTAPAGTANPPFNPGVYRAEPGVPAAAVDVPLLGPSIVKTAQLSIQVPKGHFQEAFGHATAVAGDLGGFVESSTTEGSGTHQSGSLTIRVPVGSFEQALGELRALGKVLRDQISGRDVTSQFVDLDARLRNAAAQERVLLRLLAKSPTVSASLQVQQTLSNVQLQIEELTGERRSLQGRADFSTIEVDLAEPNPPPRPPPSPVVVQAKTIQEPQLSEAWHRAKAVFFGLLYGIVVALAVLLPLGLLALVALLAVRRTRRPATE